MHFKTVFVTLTCIFCFMILNGFIGLPVHPSTIDPADEELLARQVMIYRIEPDPRGGEAFKMVYLVPASIDTFWRFKTDFKGHFFLSNKYISEHRLILETGNTVITENSYTNVPNETFRWRTTRDPKNYRLDFQLENPRECGQRFHYGSIQLEPFNSHTKVSHTAYFDFFGASLWVNLPFGGGMSAFLIYLAGWEKDTISRLRDQYMDQPAE